MAENNEMKSISQLDDIHFLVEDYQRGYKWTSTEVEQLLDDINEFDGDGFYCLQPVVVKEVIENSVKKIELIDGQQRITTLYLILLYFNELRYCIDYRTRTSSKDFLEKMALIVNKKNIIEDLDELLIRYNNIDNYHFVDALKTIKSYFEQESMIVIKESFIGKLLNKVKIIWYEIPASGKTTKESKQESIKIFTRINSGKIPLTNGELIKALFLINIDNGDSKELLQLKQNEIAQQWDTIEYALQNDAFWYFLSNEDPPATRIDLIFNLIKAKPKDVDDKLFTFLAYNLSFSKESDKVKWVDYEWIKVKKTFLTLQDWFEDRALYHKIGYLISINPQTLTDLYKKNFNLQINKSDFLENLRIKIKDSIGKVEFKELSYEENKDVINKILLLYNILSGLKNKSSNSKYQFDVHKKKEWSLEHIHAQKQNDLKDKGTILSYIEEFIKYLRVYEIAKKEDAKKEKKEYNVVQEFLDANDEYLKKIDGVNDNLVENFKHFIQRAKERFPDLFDLHSLDNMALLSREINSSIGNGFFNEKRNKIIEYDKNGSFIPPCTKNVFLKYYSKKESITNLFYWSSSDREDYLKDIEDTLNGFFN